MVTKLGWQLKLKTLGLSFLLLLLAVTSSNAQVAWKPSLNIGELSGVNPGIDLIDLRPATMTKRIGGWDWLNDNEIVFGNWEWDRGEIWVLTGLKTPSKAGISIRRYYPTDIREPLGIKVVNGVVYVAHKWAITKLIDADKNGTAESAETIVDFLHNPDGANLYSMDLKYKDGFFYTALPSLTTAGGGVGYPVPKERGTVAKVNLTTKTIEYLCWGLRTPDGLGWGPEGELFTTDNQGAWLPSSKLIHVTKNRFFGLQPVLGGDPTLVESPPAIWMPHLEASNSPTQPMLLSTGPFAGQMLIGDDYYGNVHRAFLEKVNGEFQGALFHYTGGLTCGVHRFLEYANGDVLFGGLGDGSTWAWQNNHYGLQLMKNKPTPAFEVAEILSRSNGFTLRFTRPVGLTAESPDYYHAESWSYKPTNDYGGPKIGFTTLTVNKVTVDASRMLVNLQIPNLVKGKVVHFSFHADLKSTANEVLWTGESWYTLNSISTEAAPFPVGITPRKVQTDLSNPKVQYRNGALLVSFNQPVWDKVEVRNGKGILVLTKNTEGQSEMSLPMPKTSRGLHIVSMLGNHIHWSQKILVP